jgi:hypothetical protein
MGVLIIAIVDRRRLHVVANIVVNILLVEANIAAVGFEGVGRG